MIEPIVVAVQARMGSTRLPGKVMEDLAGQPMLAFQLARLRTLSIGRIVVATSDLPGDDPIADLAARAGVEIVRGPESDVLARFGAVLDRFSPETVIRLTADCPLTDPVLVAQVLQLHDEAGADYTSNVLPRSFPRGLDVEVASAKALRIAVHEATDPAEREHVTPYLYRAPERFRLANFLSDRDYSDRSWTVDTAQDLARVRSIVDRLDDPIGTPWGSILAVDSLPTTDGPSLAFHPAANPEPGSCPWVRTWVVAKGPATIGTAAVAVGNGAARQEIDVDDADLAAVEVAFESFLQLDQQLRLRRGPTS